MPIDADAYMAGAIPSISRGTPWDPASSAPGAPDTSFDGPDKLASTSASMTVTNPWAAGPTPWNNPFWFPRTPFSFNPGRVGMPHIRTSSPLNSTAGSQTADSPPSSASHRKSSRSPNSPVSARHSPLRQASHPTPASSASGTPFQPHPVKYGGWATPDPVRSAASSVRSVAHSQVRSVAGSRITNIPQPSVGAHHHHGLEYRHLGEGGSWERQSGTPKQMLREPIYGKANGHGGPYKPLRRAAEELPPPPSPVGEPWCGQQVRARQTDWTPSPAPKPTRPGLHRRHTHDAGDIYAASTASPARGNPAGSAGVSESPGTLDHRRPTYRHQFIQPRSKHSDEASFSTIDFTSASGQPVMDLSVLEQALPATAPLPRTTSSREYSSAAPPGSVRTKKDAPPGYISPLSTEGYERYAAHPAAATPGRADVEILPRTPGLPASRSGALTRATSDTQLAHQYLPVGLPVPTRHLEWNRDGPAMKTYGVAWKREVGENGLPVGPAGPRWLQAKPPAPMGMGN